MSADVRDRGLPTRSRVRALSWLALVAVGTSVVACEKKTAVVQTPSGTVTTTTISPSADASAVIGRIDASIARAASAVRSSEAASQALTEVGDAVADGVVTAQVKAALFTDPDTKGTSFEVETHRGVVTIRGDVSRSAVRARAERIARGTSGVKSVDNRVVVSTSA